MKTAIIKSFSGRNVMLPEQIVGFFHSNQWNTHHYVTVEELRSFFERWNEGLEGLKALLAGQRPWREPNQSFLKFEYDPTTGQKIDWNRIRNAFES